jgi:flagellar protein FliO/FliZ
MPITSLLLAVASLAAVLGLILLAGRLAGSRLGRVGTFAIGRLGLPHSGAACRLGLVQVLALDPRRRLHLIRCDDRHVLVLTGGPADQIVGWLDAPGGTP